MSRQDDMRNTTAGTIAGPILYRDNSPRLAAADGSTAVSGDDERVLYAPAIMMPDGVGATVWSSNEPACWGGSTTAAAQLASRFVPYAQCPSHVQAMLVAHANRMLERLMDDVQRIDCG